MQIMTEGLAVGFTPDRATPHGRLRPERGVRDLDHRLSNWETIASTLGR